MEEYRLTISNSNIYTWQENDYLGDITINVSKQELAGILPILLNNKCYVLISCAESKTSERDVEQ